MKLNSPPFERVNVEQNYQNVKSQVRNNCFVEIGIDFYFYKIRSIVMSV